MSPQKRPTRRNLTLADGRVVRWTETEYFKADGSVYLTLNSSGTVQAPSDRGGKAISDEELANLIR